MTTETTRQFEPFVDAKWVDTKLIALANDIQKAIPEVQFKQGELHTYNLPEEYRADGVAYLLDIYFEDDPNNRIGVVGIERYNEKYFITNRNIDSGRRQYGRGEGETKQSKHAKNIVAVAKKTLKPLSIVQVIEGYKREFEQHINGYRNKWSWEVNRKTNDAFNLGYEDMIRLKHMGYEPICAKFEHAMNYLYENRTNIDKYSRYDPHYHFVWVKPNCVEYIGKGENESKRVESLNDLPEQIRGKMFVLDISDEKQFIEDVGRKENKTAYWVMS